MSDTFHDKWMAVGCVGVDVTDWQTFLVRNSYLQSGVYTVGTFDTPTMTATVKFQMACGINSDPSGKVGPNSWSYANSYSSHHAGGHNLVSQDGTPTIESQTSCGS